MERNSFKSSGSGTIQGGKFKDVTLSGSHKVNGNVDCEIFKSAGSLVVNDQIMAKEIRISGSSKFNGSINSRVFRASGSCKSQETIKVHEFKISGSFSSMGKIESQNIKCSGAFKVSESVECEVFTGSGMINIDGLLNCGNIELYVGKLSNIKEIGCDEIKILSKPDGILSIFSILGKSNANYFCSDLIEGDNIEIERTRAKVIRGINVILRDHCEIERLEYSGTLTKENSCIIKEIVKVDALLED